MVEVCGRLATKAKSRKGRGRGRKPAAKTASAAPARRPLFAGLRQANLLLAFALEVAMLVGFGLAGWAARGPVWMKGGFALLVPAVAIVLWAAWAAPRSSQRFAGRALLGFKAGMFGAATLAWWFAGHSFIGAVFAALVVVNFCVAAVFRQG
jgi:Zn-dependent protease